MKNISPDLYSFFIPGRQGRLFSSLFTAGGNGPHPLIILLHGIPGNEKNQDFAHSFRRKGFHVLLFHYAGCWGSDGRYGLESDIDDACSALDHMISQADQYGIDKDRIYAVGHSLGGFVCAHLAARRSEIKAAVLLSPCDACSLPYIEKEDPTNGKVIREIMEESAPWLSDTTSGNLIGECIEKADRLNMRSLAPKLSGKPLMTLGATRDIYTPAAQHLEPLEKAIMSIDGSKLTSHRIDSDHFYSDSRLEVAALTEEFLARAI